MPDVRHLFPDLELDVYAGLARALRDFPRVVTQRFLAAALQEQGRQATKIPKRGETSGFSSRLSRPLT